MLDHLTPDYFDGQGFHAYVINIRSMKQSYELGNRCIESAEKYGVRMKDWGGCNPKTQDVHDYFEHEQLGKKAFYDEYSRTDQAMACFISHYSIWHECIRVGKPILICEHDAVFVAPLPKSIEGDIVNLGQPSYGAFGIPSVIGESELVSKPYLPGAHGYYITPKGARLLIDAAMFHEAAPVDLFISKARFGTAIKEVYPWPIKADDSFSTVQKEKGCKAKHNYNKKYRLI